MDVHPARQRSLTACSPASKASTIWRRLRIGEGLKHRAVRIHAICTMVHMHDGVRGSLRSIWQSCGASLEGWIRPPVDRAPSGRAREAGGTAGFSIAPTVSPGFVGLLEIFFQEVVQKCPDDRDGAELANVFPGRRDDAPDDVGGQLEFQPRAGATSRTAARSTCARRASRWA